MTDIFRLALAHTAAWEKGKANHPKDPGGVTNMGMTQALYDKMRTKYPELATWPASVNDLTPEQVNHCFQLEFWMPCHCAELPEALAVAVFDAAVNTGAGDARRWLQKALGVKVDGWIGPGTLAAARSCNQLKALSEFHALRAWSYMLQDAIDDDFGLGWSRRLIDTHNVAVGLIPPTGAPAT